MEKAKNDYKGYSLESRLHFRLHAGLHKIAQILDGFLSPELLSDTSSASVSPNAFNNAAHFTFHGNNLIRIFIKRTEMKAEGNFINTVN